MDTKRVITAVAAALVVGVVAGNVVSGWAAAPAASTTSTATSATAPARLGLRLGAAMQAGGARLSVVVARLTGLDVADVTAKRTAGTSYAEIAASKDVSSAQVVDEALKVRKTILEEKVKSGAITSAQADAALANMKTRLTERVKATDDSCSGAGGQGGQGGGCGQAGGRGKGGGMGRGMGGAGCASSTTATQ